MPDWMEYNSTSTHKVRQFTIIPEPDKIAHNQTFKLWFNREGGVENVRIRTTLSKQEIRAFLDKGYNNKKVWNAGNPISKITSVSDEPVYFVVTWTAPGKAYEPSVYYDENGSATVNGKIVGPYYVTKPDYNPPLILYSNVLPSNYQPSYAGEQARLKGRTDVDPGVSEIIILFNEPIRNYAKAGVGIGSANIRNITSNAKNAYLSWGEKRKSNAIILDALTPEELKKWQAETAVSGQRWVGTPLDTPMNEVKGKFIDVKINTVQAKPSTLLKPGSTYRIDILVHDVVGLKSEVTITFQTAH